MKKYPVLGDVRRQGKWKKETGFIPKVIGKCFICGKDATYYIDIQVSIFRGDDLVVKGCHQCVKNKKNFLEAHAYTV